MQFQNKKSFYDSKDQKDFQFIKNVGKLRYNFKGAKDLDE